MEAGAQKQVDLFGEDMADFYQSGPEETRHINRWLAENCFGDYYTRTGLDDAQREMITLCFLAAQGGCEPQLVSHAQREMITFCLLIAQGGCEPQVVSHVRANLRVGNDRAFLIKVVSQCVPYIGYPRSLNALRCIDEAVEALEADAE